MITATVSGEKKLIAHLRLLQSGIARGGNDAAKIAAEDIRDFARDFVPVDTAELRDSIRVEPASRGYNVIADRNGLHPEVAFYLEYGTARMVARPFLQPAIDIVVDSGTVGAQIRGTGGLMMRG